MSVGRNGTHERFLQITLRVRDVAMSEIATEDKGRRARAHESWGSILAAVHAVLLGFAILIIGGSVSGAFMFANLKLARTRVDTRR